MSVKMPMFLVKTNAKWTAMRTPRVKTGTLFELGSRERFRTLRAWK